MKKIKISQKAPQNLNNQPLVLVVGKKKSETQKVLSHILSSEIFYSQKYGRILYFGQKKYQSQSIILDQSNYKNEFKYQQVCDMLDQAVKDQIINILLVVNLQIIDKRLTDAIQKIIGIRNTYMKGIISVILKCQLVTQLPKQLFCLFNTYFVTQNQQMQRIMQVFGLKNQKKKKNNEIFVFSNGKLSIIQIQ